MSQIPEEGFQEGETAPAEQPAHEPLAQPTATLQRIRIRYARREALRYTSHLDMHMVWERTLRRARLPLAYTKGFHPNPRLHLASALPLGFLSRCELTDFWLELPKPPDLKELADQAQRAAPPGLEILATELVSLQEPALQTRVTAAAFSAAALDPLDRQALEEAVAALLAAPTLPREKRGKTYDLRPLIEHLAVEPGSEAPVVLSMRLAAREGATGRPEEVLLALGHDPACFRVERLSLFLSSSE